MVEKAARSQIEWFASWIENDISFPEDTFERTVVILHPGTRWISDGRIPFQMPNVDGPTDPEASEDQKRAIDVALQEAAGPDASCVFALYAGYLHEDDHGRRDGFDEPAGTWHIGRLNYVLFSGRLSEAGFAGVDQRWGSGVPFVPGRRRPFVELSYLWTADRSIVLASTADSAVTVVAGPASLAERLLSIPLLRAHVWR